MPATGTHHGGADQAFWTSRTISYSKSLAAGTLVFVSGVLDAGTDMAPNVSDTQSNSFTLNNHFDAVNIFSNIFISWSILIHPVTTADHISITINGTDGPISLDSIEGFTSPALDPAAGNPATNPPTLDSTGPSTSATWGGPPFTTADQSVLFAAGESSASSLTATSGTILFQVIGTNRSMATMWQQVSGAGSHQLTATQTSGNVGVLGYGFKDTGGGPPPILVPHVRTVGLH